MREPPPRLALVAVTAIWGYNVRPRAKAVLRPPLFIPRRPVRDLAAALAPFARRSLRAAAPAGRGDPRGNVSRARLRAADCRPQLTTVTGTGFITGLYVVVTPLLALAAFRTPVPLTVWVGVVLSLTGLL